MLYYLFDYLEKQRNFLNYASFLSYQNRNEKAINYFNTGINTYHFNFGKKHPYGASADLKDYDLITPALLKYFHQRHYISSF